MLKTKKENGKRKVGVAVQSAAAPLAHQAHQHRPQQTHTHSSAMNQLSVHVSPSDERLARKSNYSHTHCTYPPHTHAVAHTHKHSTHTHMGFGLSLVFSFFLGWKDLLDESIMAMTPSAGNIIIIIALRHFTPLTCAVDPRTGHGGCSASPRPCPPPPAPP